MSDLQNFEQQDKEKREASQGFRIQKENMSDLGFENKKVHNTCCEEGDKHKARH